MNFTDVTENEINDFLEIKEMKNYNLYDSDEYLDDVARFILKKPTNWSKNSGVTLRHIFVALVVGQVCCDFEVIRDIIFMMTIFLKNIIKNNSQ